MLMLKKLRYRTPLEKEKILLDIQVLGVIAGCRKYGLARTLYYEWLERYNAHGLEGLEDRRGKNTDSMVKRLEKENQILKELLVEKEIESKMKDELLKKKFGQQGKRGK